MNNQKRVFHRFLSKLFFITCFLLLVTGCSSKNKETTSIYEKNDDSSTTKLTFKAKGDKVVAQEAETNILYKNIGVSNEIEAQNYYRSSMSQYQGIPGLEVTMDYQDDQVIKVTKVNYEKVNMEKLANLDGFTVGSKDASKISLKDTVKAVEDMGYKKVESK